MYECIKMIKFCGAMSLVFLGLFYIATVNSEIHFIKVNSIWISNDFVVTLLGGIFASIAVVGVCGFKNYLIVKSNAECNLFYQAFYLYLALMQLQQNIEDYIDHPEWLIADNLLDESMRMIRCEVVAIQRIEYMALLPKRNIMIKCHERFRIECLPDMTFLQSGIKLRISINEEKLDSLQYNGEASLNITSANVKIFNVLNDVLKKTIFYATVVDNYINTLNDYCGNRFDYSMMKTRMVIPHISM